MLEQLDISMQKKIVRQKSYSLDKIKFKVDYRYKHKTKL